MSKCQLLTGAGQSGAHFRTASWTSRATCGRRPESGTAQTQVTTPARVARFCFCTAYQNGKYILHKCQPNGLKIYRIAVKIPNSHKMHQSFPFQSPPKYTQIGILCRDENIPSGKPDPLRELLFANIRSKFFGRASHKKNFFRWRFQPRQMAGMTAARLTLRSTRPSVNQVSECLIFESSKIFSIKRRSQKNALCK
jgi:hypothetical protein